MAVKLVAVYVVLPPLPISVGLLKPALSSSSHLVIVPVLPLKVKVVLFVPIHTVALPAILPPTLAGSTVTVDVEE